MKYKVLIPSLIIVGVLAFFSFRYINPFGSTSENQDEVILKTVQTLLERGHYHPQKMDDSFSVHVYKNLLESLDYQKKFFTQKDINNFDKFKYDIDNQFLDKNLSFYNEIIQVFNKRILIAEKQYKAALKKPIDILAKDSIETDPEKLDYAKNEKELQKRWDASIRLRIIGKYHDLLKEQNQKLKDSANYKAKTEKNLLQEAISATEKVQKRYFKRLKKLNKNDKFAFFMNAITTAYDPHTIFMQPFDKKRFEEIMSGSFIGIGATLQQQDDGRVKITSIITGSPSWQQGSLKEDDLIEKVAQGDESPVDIMGYDLEDVVKMIRGKEGTIVKLTVEKKNGTKEVIPIKRGKVDLDYIRAKSTIIQDNGMRIGYIFLPEFYADFNGMSDGRRSATDVKAEIIKLQAEKVDGIVLDLRNNGGGSLTDVVDMVGYFVGKGPVVQIKASSGEKATLRSKEAQPLYTGPLSIMINRSSASASEIMAAAIQDYRRGIIIGTPSFGKGTVQKLVSLDRFVSSKDRKMIIDQLNQEKGGNADFDGIGSLKLTIQKFYRINGGSTQLKGVQPDIVLPDAGDLLDDHGESKYDYALGWDKIAATDYRKFFNFKYDFLRLNSQKRVNANKSFNLIKTTARRIKDKKDSSKLPLNINYFKSLKEQEEKLSKQIEQLDSISTGLNVSNLKVDLSKINVDDASKEKNKKWLDALKKDPYLKETAQIMKDIIQSEH